MVAKTFNDKAIKIRADKLKRIGSQAIKKAQNENKKLGIPNAYSKLGRLYYKLPNGEVTYKNPFK
ncbi:MAG TPA: hypothetical protein ENH19_03135 [Actinobacteria bacterium]|nr:hypothetical protein [Actinomycetes bacterium]HEX21630.1 hypothetical protein [Actinomycetota bacterium]